ncbi:MAG: CBS domain-containing protein [Halobacteriovoraceae bacterium]|nr:CBS domain-containing protein [Halobacteriovoraceae bacterium]
MSFYLLTRGLLTPHEFDYVSDYPQRVEKTRSSGEFRAFPLRKKTDKITAYAIDIMIKKVIVLGPKDSVSKAVSIFKGKGFRHIPIVKSKTLIGLISDRDIFNIDKFRDFERLHIEEFMSKLVVVCDEDTGMTQIAEVFLNEKISSIPVVNKQGQFIGLITLSDILKWLIKSEILTV